jgi:hypothetical protein
VIASLIFLSVFATTALLANQETTVAPWRPSTTVRPHQHGPMQAKGARCAQVNFELQLTPACPTKPGDIVRELVYTYAQVQPALPELQKVARPCFKSKIVPIYNYRYSKIKTTQQAKRFLYRFYQERLEELEPLFVSNNEMVSHMLYEFDQHPDDWYIYNDDFSRIWTKEASFIAARLGKTITGTPLTLHQLDKVFCATCFKGEDRINCRIATGQDCFLACMAYQFYLRKETMVAHLGCNASADVDKVRQHVRTLQHLIELFTKKNFQAHVGLMVLEAQEHAESLKEPNGSTKAPLVKMMR